MAERGGVEDVARTVAFLGGVTRWRELRDAHPARLVREAVAEGAVERAARNRYVLPAAGAQFRLAQSRTAALSHLSAAVHHGWKVKTVPTQAWLTVRRKRHLKPAQLVGVRPFWAE